MGNHSKPTRDQALTTTAAHSTQVSSGGEKQPVKCRDPLFALLLLGNVGAIAGVAATYGTIAFDTTLSSNGYNYTGFVYAAFILGAIAMVFTGFCLPIMMCIPEFLIKTSLIGMLILSGVMMVISFVSGNIIGGIFSVIFFLIFMCYARAGTLLFVSCTKSTKRHFFTQATNIHVIILFSCFSMVSYSICQCQLAYRVHCGQEELRRGICGICLRCRGVWLEPLVDNCLGWRL